MGILLIYFVGRYFYNLAGDYDKNQWGFAILGVVSYYAGSFVAALSIMIIGELSGAFIIEEGNEFILDLLGIPFGILACWGLYKLLERNWGKEEHFNENIIDEIGK
ncbi:MAG: hypothetical protein AAFN10_15530 [Bacteroidota bacterium]